MADPSPQFMERYLAEQAVLRWEGTLIIQLHRLARVTAKLTKQLSVGRTHSELVGAYRDLGNISQQLKLIAEEAAKLP